VRAARQTIAASIDRGWPALFGSIEDGLVVGYEDGGETLLVRGYFDDGEPGFHPLQEWPWGFAVLSKKPEPVDRDAAVVRSLELAVDLANRRSTGSYTSGYAALAQWTDLLRLDDDAFAAADEEQDMGIQHGNAYIYVCLMDARTRAAGYLRSVADGFGTEARGHLLAAADAYDGGTGEAPGGPDERPPSGREGLNTAIQIGARIAGLKTIIPTSISATARRSARDATSPNAIRPFLERSTSSIITLPGSECALPPLTAKGRNVPQQPLPRGRMREAPWRGPLGRLCHACA
jgi:hypothetical protein